MSDRQHVTIDGNEAVASVAYRMSEVIAIYPITPASPMGEFADEWALRGMKNFLGTVPRVVEMQAEGGAAGAVHGALQAGSLATTFTASQGLLLMVPNLYKIAGELTACCIHVAARTIATHALSIFGDHSDVMACRQTGMALLCSGSPQEAQDLAAIAHVATLESRLPYLHFFDGFRTSHEINEVELLTDADLIELVDREGIDGHRERALTPDRPMLRGTAQNPDVFFQAREAANPFYDAGADRFEAVCDRFETLTGRRYRAFDYAGDPQAERVLVLMGSGAKVARETIDWMCDRGEKVGLIEVRLYRPFDVARFLATLPSTVKSIAVLDRTKEPGAPAEPLCLDVMMAIAEGVAGGTLAAAPQVIGGRYGLSSKEFDPACVKAVLDELAAPQPRRKFTVGIVDDVTGLSLEVDDTFDIEPDDVVRAIFFGLGSDGTVGANKNTIKIIGEETSNHAQGYFVYDSKKAGARTVSHLRFGPRPIQSSYLIRRASFVGVHQMDFLDRFDVLEHAAPGGTLLLNCPLPAEEIWNWMPHEVQERILGLGLELYTIDGYAVAAEQGMGRRINTVMQTCFFALSGVLPIDEAIGHMKKAIEKSYGKKSPELVRRNFAAVDGALARMKRVVVPDKLTATRIRPPVISEEAPDLVQRVTATMIAGHGDSLPVSAFLPDGTWPTATSRWEKRNLALEVPVWDEDLCIQCNKCALVCPHAAIRAKVYPPESLEGAPPTFKSTIWKGKELAGQTYTLQVAVEDCTGCKLCTEVCPARDRKNPRHKAIDMHPQPALVEAERENFRFFSDLPEVDRTRLGHEVKDVQLRQPLFEFSGACAGCGETPYLKLLTQMFGDRLLVANATGCSSIYGGNLPTTPWAQDAAGRGPAWSNSLFEDNAEFGLGFRLAVDALVNRARQLTVQAADLIGADLVEKVLGPVDDTDAGIAAQRERVVALKQKLAGRDEPLARDLDRLADYLVKKSVWIVGGDGWAYDIGFGGLDHVLSCGVDVNVLVLDTEVYSNTGGQQSKATPMGAAAKFAAAGKEQGKKDLGMMAMSYGDVYVAHVAWGAKDSQLVKALYEAESWPGPSLVIAYSPCIAHGYDLSLSAEQQKLASQSGVWPLMRFDPRRIEAGESPLVMDSPHPTKTVLEYARNQARFRIVEQQDPERFKRLMDRAQAEVVRRIAVYEELARMSVATNGSGEDKA